MTRGAIKSMKVSEKVEAVLCHFHRAVPPLRLAADCRPGECSFVTNHEESVAALRAIEALAGDLEEALMDDLSLPLRPSPTWAGTPLGSVMAIRGLAVRVLSELRNPTVPAEEARS